MKPIEYRNAAWAEIEKLVEGRRRLVWQNLIDHGPCTTRQLAFATGMDILAVRPRITELCQLGLVRLADDVAPAVQSQEQDAPGRRSSEGVYEAVGIVEAQEHHARIQRGEAVQLAMRLSA
jgi:hypothetical protein